jgi:hypothetical protein
MPTTDFSLTAAADLPVPPAASIFLLSLLLLLSPFPAVVPLAYWPWYCFCLFKLLDNSCCYKGHAPPAAAMLLWLLGCLLKEVEGIATACSLCGAIVPVTY